MKLSGILLVFLFSYNGYGQTIGLTSYTPQNHDGYVLFSGISSNETYLIDKCGNKVHEWTSSYKPGLSVDLLPTGDLLRTCAVTSPWFGSGSGKGGVVEIYDWNGNVLWNYQVSDSLYCQHHDAIVLPNGNVLVVTWASKTLSDATQAGKNPAVTTVLNDQMVWSESIIELQPINSDSAEIVWQWNAWDHLVQDFDSTKNNFGVVSDHPELLNVNYVAPGPPTNPDWLHINSVDYNPLTDEIVLSSHSFGEFWIVDHSTTTVEAAGHAGGNSGKGGDILYRWGNPQTYDRGTIADQKLFKQHHATFIKPGFPNEGKILVFNNGKGRLGGDYSSVDMIDISEAGYPYTIGAINPYAPTDLFWTYESTNPSDFYAQNISGAFALENGAILFTDGPKGEFIEINSQSEIVWSYVNPTNNTGIMTQGDIPSLNTVFRAQFYPIDYPGLAGQNLSSQGAIELAPQSPSLCELLSADNIDKSSFKLYPNPVKLGQVINISGELEHFSVVKIYDLMGVLVYQGRFSEYSFILDTTVLNTGCFLIECIGSNHKEVIRLVVVE
ncbi:MAG: aryl-sulfate sulfotransferase [Crocinitomicaceae bacterium]